MTITPEELSLLEALSGLSMAPQAKADRLQAVEDWATANAVDGVTISRGTYLLTITRGSEEHRALLGSADAVEDSVDMLRRAFPWAWTQRGGQS